MKKRTSIRISEELFNKIFKIHNTSEKTFILQNLIDRVDFNDIANNLDFIKFYENELKIEKEEKKYKTVDFFIYKIDYDELKENNIPIKKAIIYGFYRKINPKKENKLKKFFMSLIHK